MKVPLTIAVLIAPLLVRTSATSQTLDARASAAYRVSTTSGIILGHAAPNNTDVVEYLGIPYAAAPVGDKRFLPPTRFESNAILNASAYGASCPANVAGTVAFPNKTAVFDNVFLAFTTQGGNVQSEDCLNLNVWVPKSTSSSKEALPVMMFWPGGRWNVGGSKSLFYQGQYLADRENVIVVTINYRLNIFGFPGAPGLIQNAGLLDQRMAVEWLRDNIAGFGGSPSKITIFGQSAGSVSVAYYPYAYPKDSIIAGSILHSGTPHSWTPLTPELGAQHWYNASSFAGCGSSGDVLACMQGLSVAEILAAFARVPFDPSQALLQPQFQPVVDNVTVFSDYNVLAAEGRYANLPTLIGSTDLESGFYRIAAFATNRTFNITQQSLFDLAAFTCATATEAKNRVLTGARVWRYRYFGEFENLRLFPGSGSYHGSDLEMVFGTAQDVSGVPNSRVENETSAYFMQAWAAFARDPAQGLSRELKWPLYSGSNDTDATLVRLGFQNQTSASFASPILSDFQCPTLNGSPALGKGAM